MDARHGLEQRIDGEQGRLAAGMPPDREAALLAVLESVSRLSPTDGAASGSSLVAGESGARPGVGAAVHLCLTAPPARDEREPADGWAARCLARCRALETARVVLRMAETGDVRLALRGDGGIDAWLAGPGAPALWQERADIDRWARALTRAEGVVPASRAGIVAGMACQLPYPPAAEIGGISVADRRAVLAALIDVAPNTGSSGAVVADEDLVRVLGAATGLPPSLVGECIGALTLDAENAPWHAALPGGPLAPLVRAGRGRLVILPLTLVTEPLFFMARELRRRDPESWHNAAVAREAAFREDLARRFSDRRFVASRSRIVLRGAGGCNRTDIDAAIFDRKTGTLALFELKSQDALARTAAEAERRRENLRHAGRQSAAVLDWVTRNGGDEVLNRMDAATARRFRVQRVLAFVLGRYAADAGETSHNGRVAWGSWGRVLHLMDGSAAANPLLALHAGLIRGDGLLAAPDPGAPPVEVVVDGARLVVYPSWSAVRHGRASRAVG